MGVSFLSQSSRRRRGYILRIAGWFLLFLFVFVLGFTAFAQTDPGEEGGTSAAEPLDPALPAAGQDMNLGAQEVSGEVSQEAAEQAEQDAERQTIAGEAAGEEGAPVSAAAETLPEEEAEPVVALEVGSSGFETIPEEVRRPRKGEAPRYPRDLVIGTLGRGTAPEEAYALARNCLGAILVKNQASEYLAALDTGKKETIFAGLEPAAPRKFRIGGGREEPDGSVSFLFRFIGRERSIAGELYLMPGEEEQWLFDDIILEDPQELADGKKAYQYDFSPYERFF
ncbi:MAG: hypothetical protein LBQ38_11530 [Spirochaetaceae bacterium]|jgi:hypothetical protein|nr:hypothetical protein [Spirochaetaceae bacterium]